MVITFPQHLENVFYYFPWGKIESFLLALVFHYFFNIVDVFKIFIAYNGPLVLSDVSKCPLYFYGSSSAFTMFLQT